MLNSVDFSGRPFHFLGIGGIGMSAIAHILAHRKLPVSGSDLKLSHITDRLTAMGAHVFSSQDAENLSYFHSGQLPQVVCSTAITTQNPEYAAALKLGCHIFHTLTLFSVKILIIAVAQLPPPNTAIWVGRFFLNAGISVMLQR